VPRASSFVVMLVVGLNLGASFARAAEAAPPSATPGLALRLERLGGSGPATPDVRDARLVALYVPVGMAPSPFVPAGRFRATWEGSLNLKIRERYSFGAEGRGKITVTIDDKTVFETSGDDLSKKAGESVRLKKGANKLVVTYESPETGDASVRLLWSQPGTPAQPPVPTVYTHEASANLLHGRQLRAGRQLVAELRCTKCHAAPAPGEFPELAMDAPSFKDIGARLNRDWMAAWIANPHAIRADAHMPKVFHAGNRPAGMTAESDTRAADVAAYLAMVGTTAANAPAPAAADVDAGRKLYATLACVACHVPPGAKDAAKELARVSHEFIAAKFTPAGLKQYLVDPEAHYAWNPMPNFRLSDAESTKLAAYLLATSSRQLPSSAKAGDPKRGEQLVASAGCTSCHGGLTPPGKSAARSFADLRGKETWSRGCVASDESHHGTSPVFTLTSDERAALSAFSETDRSALTRDNPIEFAERQFAAMRCGHCHPRDGDESSLATTLAPEHDAAYSKLFPTGAAEAEKGVYLAPDQKRFPPLTWAGEKLRPEWATSFIAGEVTYKPRPYLRARMPAFKLRAAGLAQGFAMEHGCAPQTEPYPKPDPALVPIGQKLIGTVGGFSCVQCHAVAGAQPLAPFEAPAIDFMHVTERLRKDYYDRWMLNPIALDPATKMPRFSDDDGKTPLRDTLDGEAVKQFDAIWLFLRQGVDAKRPQ
jgi:mono/diheme cytochrome c family protein